MKRLCPICRTIHDRDADLCAQCTQNLPARKVALSFTTVCFRIALCVSLTATLIVIGARFAAGL
jgi:hypothetical protein